MSPQNCTDSLITSKAGILLAFICIVFGESEGLLLQTLWPHVASFNLSEPVGEVDSHGLGSDQQTAFHTEELDLLQNIPSVNAQLTKLIIIHGDCVTKQFLPSMVLLHFND